MLKDRFQLNQIIQRLFSVAVYTMPLKASLPFGNYLFYKFSFLKVLLYFTFPVAIIESSLPFSTDHLFTLLEVPRQSN